MRLLFQGIVTIDRDPSTTGDITFNGTCYNNTHMRFGISISATDSITQLNNITIRNIKFINIRENAIAVKGYRSITSGFVNHINTVTVDYCYVSALKGRIDNLLVSSAAMLFQKTQNISIRHSSISLLDDVAAQTDGIFVGASPWEIKDSTSSNIYQYLDNSISITRPGGEAGANVYYYIEARLNSIPTTSDNTDTIYVNNPEKEKEKRNGSGVHYGFSLSNNYPNPFNPSTIIRFSIAEEVPVMVKVYNILGQEIKTLLNEVKTPGNYEVNFDSGTLASGIYFYSLKAGDYSAVKKMQLVR